MYLEQTVQNETAQWKYCGVFYFLPTKLLLEWRAGAAPRAVGIPMGGGFSKTRGVCPFVENISTPVGKP